MEVILLFIAIPIAFSVARRDIGTVKENPNSEDAKMVEHKYLWVLVILSLVILFASL